MCISPPVLKADKVIFPFLFFPLLILFSSGSIPWSIAFLTRCIMGSEIQSAIVLSISVSSPFNTSSTSLFNSFPISLTILCILLNVPEIGTILKDITISCSSSVSFLTCLVDFLKLSEFNFFISASDSTMDSAITSSPTISTSLSSFERLTVIKLCLHCFEFADKFELFKSVEHLVWLIIVSSSLLFCTSSLYSNTV